LEHALESQLIERRVIEQTEELCAELQRGVFVNATNPCGLRQGGVEIELAGAVDVASARVAPTELRW